MNNIIVRLTMILVVFIGLLSACNAGQTEIPEDLSSVDSQVQPTTPPTPIPTVTKVELTRPGAARYYVVYDPLLKRIILVGFKIVNTDVWAYDVASQKLTRLKDRPETYIDCLDYNTSAGGVVTNNEVTGVTRFYDPVKDEWSELEKHTSEVDIENWGDCSFVYDIESGKQLLNGRLIYDYSSNSWSGTDLETNPPAHSPEMAYDSESDRILLWDHKLEKNIWAYDFKTNTWEKLPYIGGPEKGGVLGAAVYVSDLDRTFFYYLDQFYAYDYNTTTWEKAKGELKPGSRLMQSMAYDPVAKKIVMYGGQDENGTTLYNDLWTYDPQTGEWMEQPLP